MTAYKLRDVTAVQWLGDDQAAEFTEHVRAAGGTAHYYPETRDGYDIEPSRMVVWTCNGPTELKYGDYLVSVPAAGRSGATEFAVVAGRTFNLLKEQQ